MEIQSEWCEFQHNNWRAQCVNQFHDMVIERSKYPSPLAYKYQLTSRMSSLLIQWVEHKSMNKSALNHSSRSMHDALPKCPNHKLISLTFEILRRHSLKFEIKALCNSCKKKITLGPCKTRGAYQISIHKYAIQQWKRTYCMPKQFLVPRENGPYVFSVFFLASKSVHRSGSNLIGSGYRFSSVCINNVVMPIGVPAGIRHSLYHRSLSGAILADRDATAGLSRKPSINTEVK